MNAAARFERWNDYRNLSVWIMRQVRGFAAAQHSPLHPVRSKARRVRNDHIQQMVQWSSQGIIARNIDFGTAEFWHQLNMVAGANADRADDLKNDHDAAVWDVLAEWSYRQLEGAQRAA